MLLISLAIAASLALVLRHVSSQNSGLLAPDNAKTMASGKQIYDDNCASCHGANLEGEPNWRLPNEDGTLRAPPHDESGHTWHHDEATLFAITKFGVGKMIGKPEYTTNMPTYDGILTDQEIIQVLSFIKSHWSEETQKRHSQMKPKP